MQRITQLAAAGSATQIHYRCCAAQVIGLAAGQPDFATPAAIAQAGKAAIDAGQTTYTPNTGTPALRAAIAAKLRADNGLEYGDDEIVVSNGAKQSISQAVLACVAPGDEVIVPAPFWVSYPEMVKLAGGTPVVVPCGAAEGFLMSAAQLEAALTERTRLVIVCTPSNPSGAVYSRAGLEALAAVVARHPRALVVSDEIYELITYAPAEHVSFAALPGMWERTITVNGMSKAFAMTGWRIGYAAAPRHFAAAMAVIQSQSTSGACSISQVRCAWPAAEPCMQCSPLACLAVLVQAISPRTRREETVRAWSRVVCAVASRRSALHAGGVGGGAAAGATRWRACGTDGGRVPAAARLHSRAPAGDRGPAGGHAAGRILCAA